MMDWDLVVKLALLLVGGLVGWAVQEARAQAQYFDGYRAGYAQGRLDAIAAQHPANGTDLDAARRKAGTLLQGEEYDYE